MISHIHANIKIFFIYECAKCGVMEKGHGCEYLTVKEVAPRDIETILSRVETPPESMPLGWYSYHSPKRTLFCCTACKEKEDDES